MCGEWLDPPHGRSTGTCLCLVGGVCVVDCGWYGCVRGFVDGCLAILDGGVCGRAVSGLFWWGVVKGVKCILDILGHGDVNMAVFVVPIQGHATVQGAIPINGDGVVLLEGVTRC